MPGYWEPHTSSIDFCEPNYALSHYVAEPHNVWSSLYMAAIALVGVIHGNPIGEWCVSVMYLVLVFVGVGSAGLHSSLHWLYQSSDEVPMLWQTLTFIHMMYICRMEKKGKQGSNTGSLLFLLVGTLLTVFYYTFQQKYIVFLLSFALSVAIIVVWDRRIVHDMPEGTNKALRVRMHRWAVFLWVGCAFSLWLVDMNFCDQLMPIYLHTTGFTLHVLWHLLAGFGTFLTATSLVVLRLHDCGHEAELLWIGFLPVARISKKKE